MREIRIIHAADLHLDSPFAGLSAEKAAQRRGEQRALLSRLADLCREREANLLLLAGDLFDSDRTFAETGEALSEALARVEIPVFIAPGNHDWYAPFSPWRTLALPENVHLFTAGAIEAVALPALGCVVYGAGFTAPSSPPLLTNFTAPEDGLLHIMVLHGALGSDSPYNPIAEAEIAASGLDYLALGHVHTCSGLQRAGRTSWCYPGCTEGRGFDETGEKGAMCLTLGPDGVQGELVPLAARRYMRLTLDIGEAADPVAAVLDALASAAPEDLYRIVLQGETDAPAPVAALEERLRGRFFALEVRDETRLTQDLWQGAGEETLRGLFLQKLLARYGQAADEGERETITRAARLGLAALEGREIL